MEFLQNTLYCIKKPFANAFPSGSVSSLFDGNFLNCTRCGDLMCAKYRKKSPRPPRPPKLPSELTSDSFQRTTSKPNTTSSKANSSHSKFTIERINNEICKRSKELRTISSWIEKFRDAQNKQTVAIEKKYVATRFATNKSQNTPNGSTYATADVNHEMFIPCEGFDKFYEHNATYRKTFFKNSRSLRDIEYHNQSDEDDDGYTNVELQIESHRVEFKPSNNSVSIVRPPPRRKKRRAKQPPCDNKQCRNDFDVQHDAHIYEDVCRSDGSYSPPTSNMSSLTQDFVALNNHRNNVPIITTQPRKSSNHLVVPSFDYCEVDSTLLANFNNCNSNNHIDAYECNNNHIQAKSVNTNTNILNSKINNLKNFNSNPNSKIPHKLFLKSRFKSLKNKSGCSNIDLTTSDRLNHLNPMTQGKKYSRSFDNLSSSGVCHPLDDVFDSIDRHRSADEYVESKVYYISGKDFSKSEYNLHTSESYDNDEEIIICESIVHTVQMQPDSNANLNPTITINDMPIPENSTYCRLYSDSLYKDDEDRKSMSSIDVQLEQLTHSQRTTADERGGPKYPKIIRSPLDKLKAIYQ